MSLSTHNAIQMLSIGDKPIELRLSDTSLDSAMELHEMVGQVFVLRGMSWDESGRLVARFEPGNGVAFVVQVDDQ